MSTKRKGRKKTTHGVTTTRAIKAAQRQARALELRARGWRLDEIAEELGYRGDSRKASAFNAIKAALKKAQQEPAEDLKKLHRERHKMLFRCLMPDLSPEADGIPPFRCPHCNEPLEPKRVAEYLAGMIDKKHSAADRIVRVLKREAELEGLDAPTKQHITGGLDIVKTEMEYDAIKRLAGSRDGRDAIRKARAVLRGQ